jgi:Fe-S-cluster containining protein
MTRIKNGKLIGKSIKKEDFMEISNPKNLKFAPEMRKKMKTLFGVGYKLLGPDDTFRFTCSKCMSHCKYGPDRIIVGEPILSPYDVIRISRSLDMDTTDFIRSYTNTDHSAPLGQKIALKFIGLEDEKRCHFLRPTGCDIHSDRPFACRIFPLRRLIIGDITAYVLPTNQKGCALGSGKKRTLKKWLGDPGLAPYFDYYRNWNILDAVDMDKFTQESSDFQYNFRMCLYDIDGMGRHYNLRGKSKSVEDTLELSYLVCKQMLKQNACLLESEPSNG